MTAATQISRAESRPAAPPVTTQIPRGSCRHNAVFWKAPHKREDWPNSLHDAFVSLPAGGVLVYRRSLPGSVTGKPAPETGIAERVAIRLGGALVQWPEEPCRGDDTKVRTWCYGIQKPARAA